MKVESGTTLKVIKLLYEAEHDKKGQILGVRPKQFAEGIPCIVTLDESKLNESSYDILVSGKHYMLAFSVCMYVSFLGFMML